MCQRLVYPPVIAPQRVLRAVCLYAASLLPSFASAQPTLTRTAGPDIIVGHIIDTQSYGTSAGTGLFAYDLGTESCNLGSHNADWVQETNQHPVIAQNVYRVRDNRFEQVGLSWLKHGFTALAGNSCNLGCNGQTGNVLGVGCSDPYTFGINGLQLGLGPRFEVNPTTGLFPFPFTAPPFSGVLARRIQIHQNDIDPALNPGAVYIAEAQYVALDDALAGNATNNASYRFITFSSVLPFRESSLNPLSATRQTKPAIYAWQEIDPQVRITPVDVPAEGVGGGQLYVAQKVYQLAPGLWRYQFAIQNLNCERAVRAFEIARNGDSPANITFAGVRYHSGEPFSNDPWLSTLTTTSLRWSTQDFATSPNAPALRWGTAYAFGFESTLAPGEGSARLSLFKPGSGVFAALNDLNVPLLTPGGATMPALPAPGDDCSSPIGLHSGLNAMVSLSASSLGPDACTEHQAPQINADVWGVYTYADSCPGPITFSTCGSSIDTKLAVYPEGLCPTLPAHAIACSDDAPVPGCNSPDASSVTFNATPNTSYLVRVGSRDASAGLVLLTITPPYCGPLPGACCSNDGGCTVTGGPGGCTEISGHWQGELTLCSPNPCPQPPRPANDACLSAIPIADVNVGGSIVDGSNIFALTDAAPFCENGGADVWYSYVPATSATVVVDLCNTPSIDFADTVLQILQGPCTLPTSVACVDDGCGNLRSRLTFQAAAGTRYLVRVMGFSGNSGQFKLRLAGGGGTLHGACCQGSTCTVTLPQACTGLNRAFAGVATVCNAPANTTTPCCKADFDQSGAVSVQDIFAFLDAWFTGSTTADIVSNGSTPPTVQSIFAFLNAWFTGCG